MTNLNTVTHFQPIHNTCQHQAHREKRKTHHPNAAGHGHMSQTGPKKCFIPQNSRKYTNFD